MGISRIRIEDVRCIEKAEFTPHPKFTLLSGANGSGKSSFLEAVYLLGMARSFRTPNIKKVINHKSHQCSVTSTIIDDAHLSNHIGISKNRDNQTTIRSNQQTLKSASELARILPIRVISQESFYLIDGPSKGRRQFFDWLVFHVEPSFNACWSAVQRLIKQRNALLRNGLMNYTNELSIWDDELVMFSNRLSEYRSVVFEVFQKCFNDICFALLPGLNIRVSLYKGWKEKAPLQHILRDNIERDIKLGYTVTSPNRADLLLTTGEQPVAENLSRGQKKLLICALTLAQLATFERLKKESELTNLVLIDDVCAELDQSNRCILLDSLERSNSQVFITGTELQAMSTLLPKSTSKVFHVEQGEIFPD